MTRLLRMACRTGLVAVLAATAAALATAGVALAGAGPAITEFELTPEHVSSTGPDALFTANQSGFYELRLEGSATCDDGVLLDSGGYVAPLESSVAIAIASLAAGENTIRLCLVSPSGTASETDTVTVYPNPPQTVLDEMPAAVSGSSTATFAFSSPDAGSTFECSLDGGTHGGPAFVACLSPIEYTSLTDEAHVFLVRAVNPAGVSDPTPAARVWTVDTIPPETSLLGAPSGTLAQREVTLHFVSPEAGASFQCKLNGGAFQTCGSPRTYTGLSDGPHTVMVRAVDSAGNADASPALAAFTVDAPPETTILAGPVGAIATAGATFVFAGTSPGDTFECSLDGGPYASCPSPHKVSGLGAGAHTLDVRAVDAGGERDPTPVRSSWSVVPVAASPTVFAANVRKARVKPGDHRALLTWRRPKDSDYDHVEIVRIPGKKKQARSLVYRGNKIRFIDRGLKNGVEYMWILYATDRKGNRSGGVTLKATAPVRVRLGRRAVVKPNTPIVFQWKGRKRARFYNVQLFRGKTKVLSSWPGRATVSLVGPWNWEGRKRKLVAGKYEWFVWPGFGKRADSNFGKLIGSGKLIVRKR